MALTQFENCFSIPVDLMESTALSPCFTMMNTQVFPFLLHEGKNIYIILLTAINMYIYVCKYINIYNTIISRINNKYHSDK